MAETPQAREDRKRRVRFLPFTNSLFIPLHTFHFIPYSNITCHKSRKSSKNSQRLKHSPNSPRAQVLSLLILPPHRSVHPELQVIRQYHLPIEPPPPDPVPDPLIALHKQPNNHNHHHQRRKIRHHHKSEVEHRSVLERRVRLLHLGYLNIHLRGWEHRILDCRILHPGS